MFILSSMVLAAGLASATDFSSVSGQVLIAAPTASDGPTNQGVWFIDPNDKSFSLRLPELPANMVYEGWIVDACTGRKMSTGVFRHLGGIDSDAAGPHAGPRKLDFPPVPGSDFVMGNLADGGHSVVITVEPYPDMDPNPSGTAVLRATIPAGATVGQVVQLEKVNP